MTKYLETLTDGEGKSLDLHNSYTLVTCDTFVISCLLVIEQEQKEGQALQACHLGSFTTQLPLPWEPLAHFPQITWGRESNQGEMNRCAVSCDDWERCLLVKPGNRAHWPKSARPLQTSEILEDIIP